MSQTSSKFTIKWKRNRNYNKIMKLYMSWHKDKTYKSRFYLNLSVSMKISKVNMPIKQSLRVFLPLSICSLSP